MFIQDPLLLDGVGRDSPFETVEEFICCLYIARFFWNILR